MGIRENLSRYARDNLENLWLSEIGDGLPSFRRLDLSLECQTLRKSSDFLRKKLMPPMASTRINWILRPSCLKKIKLLRRKRKLFLLKLKRKKETYLNTMRDRLRYLPKRLILRFNSLMLRIF